MKLKELNKTQKKKILYSLLGVGLVLIVAVVSWLSWTTDTSIKDIANQLPAALITYLSLAFFIFKVIWFFVTTYKKTKQRAKEINEIIKEDIKMSKKHNTRPSNYAHEFSKDFESQNFKFSLSKSKEIVIKAKANFNGSEDFYKKFRMEIDEFTEHLRKFLAGEVE